MSPTKQVTSRLARAEGFVAMAPATLELILAGQAPKGDVLATARIAAIMAAKRTHELIPLCHALPLSEVSIEFEPSRDPAGLRVEATAKVDAKTGVEMEALVAVSIACLTIYDMCKAVDRAMSFSGIRLLEKTGGRSGTFQSADGSAFRRRSSGARDERHRAARSRARWRSTAQEAACWPRILPRVSPSRRSMPRPWTAMRYVPPMWPPFPPR